MVSLEDWIYAGVLVTIVVCIGLIIWRVVHWIRWEI